MIIYIETKNICDVCGKDFEYIIVFSGKYIDCIRICSSCLERGRDLITEKVNIRSYEKPYTNRFLTCKRCENRYKDSKKNYEGIHRHVGYCLNCSRLLK